MDLPTLVQQYVYRAYHWKPAPESDDKEYAQLIGKELDAIVSKKARGGFFKKARVRCTAQHTATKTELNVEDFIKALKSAGKIGKSKLESYMYDFLYCTLRNGKDRDVMEEEFIGRFALNVKPAFRAKAFGCLINE
eukprot:CAMPEP_0183367704 /NCGR_PEP_ID=MMETSP0164_2-20130417/93363_1 /TAXON_ID=221442 /ORGANISM="Coccolithus pelagicus ssp braarudi, Strain PLY182g" /LENGTH=135 /DNA_ID=CAMNT_0025543681 /DNA_START=12 /DNA_END=416 /DNA_ORIENTATION=-